MISALCVAKVWGNTILARILIDELLTKNQVLFFLGAMFLFSILMMVLYRQDKKRDKEYFKGTWIIFGVLMLIVTLLFLFVLSQK